MCECEELSVKFSEVDERRARKSHICYECKTPILIGETYVYYRGSTHEHGFWDAHVCKRCEIFREWFEGLSGVDVCIGNLENCLFDDIIDPYGSIDLESVRQLIELGIYPEDIWFRQISNSLLIGSGLPSEEIRIDHPDQLLLYAVS